MNTQKRIWLLPYRFQIIGGVITAIASVAFFWVLFTSRNASVLIGIYSFIFLGLFLIGLSREKTEDEFTLFLRTRSALTAIAIMFGLRILLALTTSLTALLVSEDVSNGILSSMFYKSFKELTNYGGAFILYGLLYKFRLARYNIRLARDNQKTDYEE